MAQHFGNIICNAIETIRAAHSFAYYFDPARDFVSLNQQRKLLVYRNVVLRELTRGGVYVGSDDQEMSSDYARGNNVICDECDRFEISKGGLK